MIASDSRENNQQSLAKLHTFSLLGIEAVPVDVEVDVSQAAIPKTILVGLPEAAVKESTQRVERAMVNSGYQRPFDRVVLNLAPAELPKQAASFDLPITLGVLAGGPDSSPWSASSSMRSWANCRWKAARVRPKGAPVDGHFGRPARGACAVLLCRIRMRRKPRWSRSWR